MKQPFRFWMTGCVAVVMSALGGGRMANAASDRNALSQSSRFRVLETVQRIEACAPRHGLSVFARLDANARPQYDDRGEYALIVFESSDGGTPVLMEGPASAPEVPLAVCVRSDAQGETEVVFTGSDWDDLPPSVARELTELPMLVAEALQ